MYHYGANNPVKYTDPDGKKTKDAKVQCLVDNLGKQDNLPISKELIKHFEILGYEYIGNNSEKIQQANTEIKQLAQDDYTMVDSWPSQKTINETEIKEKTIAEQYKNAVEIAAAKMIGAKPSVVAERNSGSTTTVTNPKTYEIQIYVVDNIDPNTSKEGPIFKTFLDINKDGNIDFVIWGHAGGYNEN